MPSGRAHTRVGLALLMVLAAGTIYFWAPLTEYFGQDKLVECGLLFVLAYFFGTYLLSPDMDLARSEAMYNWGLLRLLWYPYAKFLKHRGLSHIPILGTLSRVFYLLILAYLGIFLANLTLGFNWQLSISDVLRQADKTLFASALLGLCLPDIFHILADRLTKRQ